jgi:hypothetical protein
MFEIATGLSIKIFKRVYERINNPVNDPPLKWWASFLVYFAKWRKLITS